MLIALIVAGCGGSSPNAGAKREAERVASGYADAMWRLDFHQACALEFTNRRGPAYRDKTEADKKRECEVGWRHADPAQPPGLGLGPGEMQTVKRWWGLSATEPESGEISGETAVVMLRDPRTDQHREIRLLEEEDRWVVYRESVEHRYGP